MKRPALSLTKNLEATDKAKMEPSVQVPVAKKSRVKLSNSKSFQEEVEQHQRERPLQLTATLVKRSTPPKQDTWFIAETLVPDTPDIAEPEAPSKSLSLSLSRNTKPDADLSKKPQSKENAFDTKTALPNVGYKYKESVRDKGQRQHMHAGDCPCCHKFFKATMNIVPKTGNANADMSAEEALREQYQRRKALSSRHRTLFETSNTPEGFWDVGFNDEIKIAKEEDD